MKALSDFTLETLEATLADRIAAGDDTSYTRKLASRGIETCAQKIGEEAVETVIAAVADDGTLANESADLLYHLMVLWADAGIAPQDIWAALESRTGTSGIAEKASRSKG